MADKPQAEIGRPSSYRPEYAEQARKLVELGATDREVADFIGISERTLYRWKHEHPIFCQALKVGKDVADDRVEQSLYRRATGYTYDSEKVFMVDGKPVRVPVVEHVPPSDTATIFWLKNRRRQEWRDVRQMGSDPENPLPGGVDLDEAVKRVTERLYAMKIAPEATKPGEDLV